MPTDTPAPSPRRRLADHLREAIAAGEIQVRYQPQVAMAGDRITGVEVLARWRHPRQGELGAGRLFDAAARANLAPQLSRHIRAITLAEIAAWRPPLTGLTVALNTIAAELVAPNFAGEMLRQLHDHAIEPARLTIEITEHQLIADLAAASATLATLREAGVRVALDDFGTGYSSIGYLKALPLDYLKLDGGLAADIMGTARDQIVVRHVIAMGRELGLAVVAEGVETEEHRDRLKEAGATHYQGYLCAEPLTGEALPGLLAGWSERPRLAKVT